MRIHDRQNERREGSLLLELFIAIVVITMAIASLGVLFVSSHRSHDVAAEEGVATHAMRRTVEQLRGENFDDIALFYKDYKFTVSEIKGTGVVTVLTDETANIAELGMPRDLDGDGVAKTSDVSGDYLRLPIRLDVSWTGVNGPRTHTLYTFLSEESGTNPLADRALSAPAIAEP
jgi:type II secretory pathway pseudopilin PulG